MNKLFRPYLALLLMGTLLTFSACKDDDPNPDPADEQEVITAVTISLSPTGKGQDAEATVSTISGSQKQNTPLVLRPGTEYEALITLADENQTPVVDRTEEIRLAGNNHLFVYTFTPDANSQATMAVNIDDSDQNNRPLGLKTIIKTGPAGNGKLKVVLKHQPRDLKTGTNTTAGSTDIEVDFNVMIAN